MKLGKNGICADMQPNRHSELCRPLCICLHVMLSAIWRIIYLAYEETGWQKLMELQPVNTSITKYTQRLLTETVQ